MSGKINKLECESFNQLLDGIIENLENSTDKKIDNSPIIETMNKAPELIGGKIGEQMVAIQNKEGRYIIVYSNAATCAKSCNINPTTARQRALKEWIDEKERKWSYIGVDKYNELIK